MPARVLLAILAVLLIVGGVALVRPGTDSRSSSPVVPSVRTPVANPARTVQGAAANVTFYYSGGTALEPRNVPALRRELGRASIVVTTHKADPGAAVRTIHDLGAKAYLYVQYFWVPSDREYGGIDLSRHPGWAFCGSGSTPMPGRTTSTGERWMMLDSNEQALRRRIADLMQQYKQEGWDGVMFDRGAASTQPGGSVGGGTLWHTRSTCTSRPYRQEATFSDAFVNDTALAQNAGLQVMVNNGRSPFEVNPMRADPRDPDCRRGRWSDCRFIGDIWDNANLVLNETPAHVRATRWRGDFRANRRSEQHARHGGRAVALITTADLGGEAGQNRRTVYYEWAQVKLFDLAAGVNTGTGSCPETAVPTACNQYGVYPELVDVRYGRPLRAEPDRQRCGAGTPMLCVWSRLYRHGADVVNVTAREQRRVRLRLGVSGCRYVYDVYRRTPLADNRCVSRVTLRMDPWSGRPLVYSTSAF